jgi:hypothetical protein
MRKLILLSLAIVYALTLTGQNTEFTIHDNGLIYDEQTMARLGHIVDSLNVRFQTCEPKDYQSLEQGFATVVLVEKDVARAKKAINDGIHLETFLQQFPHAKHRREWIVKSRYSDYRDNKVLAYASLPLRHGDDFRIQRPDRRANDRTRGWLFEEQQGTLVAFYIENVQSSPIPGEYAQLIQYVDCMIDTTAQLYLTDHKHREFRELPPDSKITQYLKFAEDFKGEPKMPQVEWDSPSAEAQYNKYSREHEQWNNKRLAWLDEKMRTGDGYRVLLTEAADEAVENGTGNELLEFYVERYLSPQKALKMKRLRQPVGLCSMDQRPRFHAQSICRLAAETTQWDIFLRAHLDIMNDNFERRSDGSYAWERRGTYLRELEELDINAPDLLIGTGLRAENVGDNHYFGDIGRLGRALSETRQKEALEHRLLQMIEDKDLDLYNRLMMAYLFENYNYHLQDETRKKSNTIRFRDAIVTMPEQIGKSFEK